MIAGLTTRHSCNMCSGCEERIGKGNAQVCMCCLESPFSRSKKVRAAGLTGERRMGMGTKER
jgi:hypothetical protein